MCERLDTMAYRAPRLMYPKVTLEVHSEHSEYYITNDTGKSLSFTKNDMQKGIVSFRTQNDLENDTASFSLVLSGDVRWDKVINENDIIVLHIIPNEDGNKQTPTNSNIFTGMVSDIARNNDYSADTKMYQITGQSLAKAFLQFKIGLISQVEQQISSMGWLWDTNAEYDAESSDDSGGPVDGGSISTKSQKSFVKTLAPYAKYAYSECGILPDLFVAQAAFESAWGTSYAAQHDNNLGGNKWKEAGQDKPGSVPSDNTGGVYGHYPSKAVWAENQPKYLKRYNFSGNSVMVQVGQLHNGGYFTASVESYYNGIEPIVKTVDSIDPSLAKARGGKNPSSSSNDDDLSDDSGKSGTVDSTQDQIDKEKANSIGVAFFGNDAATIEKNLINRFKPYMKYSYDGGTKDYWDFLDYTKMQSWSDYEYLYDSSSFTNANGSLYDLQQSALRAPFNEMFYEPLSSGKSHLVVRRTPFNPDDWAKLSQTTIDSSSLISDNTSKNDAQEYSVFVVNPASSTLLGISDGMLLSAYPQTKQELIDKYGYSKYEVDDLYLSGKDDNNSKEADKKEEDKNNVTGVAYDADAFNKWVQTISKANLRLNKSKYAKALAKNANNLSAAQAMDLVNAYISNGYVMTPDTFNRIVQSDSGGGLPNTGTHVASYENVVYCLNKAGNDQTTFMSVAKSYLENVSDEFLREIWANRNSNGTITRKAYKKVYDSYRDAGDTTSAATAGDLKAFTQILYNWYADNFNFFSGDVITVGDPDIRIGTILNVIDGMDKDMYNYPGMRYYVEGVSHSFSFTEGFTTDVKVTRGMRAPRSGEDDPRFHNLWGTSIDYKGGYMGEPSIANLALAVSDSSDSSGSESGSGSAFSGPKGNEIAVKAAQYGYKFRKSVYAKPEVYALGGYGERGSVNPLTHDINAGKIILDCSSFVYWCFNKMDVTTATSTWSFMNDTQQFSHVAIPSNTTKGMKIGDLVLLYGGNHIMFYIGSGLLMGWNGGSGGKASYDTSGGCMAVTLASMGNVHIGYVLRYK